MPPRAPHRRAAKDIKWSESGDLVVIVCDESFFVLRYNRELVSAAFESGQPLGEEGVDDAFEIVHEISETIRTCVWVGDCLLYSNTAGRLNYTIGSEVITLQHLDRPLYIVGYIKKDNRIYMIDRDFSLVSFQLLLSVLEYQTAVVRRDFEAAAKHLPSVPREEYNRIARFLEAGLQGGGAAGGDGPRAPVRARDRLQQAAAASSTRWRSPRAKWKQIADPAMLASNVASRRSAWRRRRLAGAAVLLIHRPPRARAARRARRRRQAQRLHLLLPPGRPRVPAVAHRRACAGGVLARTYRRG